MTYSLLSLLIGFGYFLPMALCFRYYLNSDLVNPVKRIQSEEIQSESMEETLTQVF